jgi:hypothetical protein
MSELLHLGEPVPERLKVPTEKPNWIILRTEPDVHYEVHFQRYVEFRSLDGKCQGYSEVETIES